MKFFVYFLIDEASLAQAEQDISLFRRGEMVAKIERLPAGGNYNMCVELRYRSIGWVSQWILEVSRKKEYVKRHLITRQPLP